MLRVKRERFGWLCGTRAVALGAILIDAKVSACILVICAFGMSATYYLWGGDA